MITKIHQKIEIFANLAIVIVAVLLGYFLIQNLFFPTANNNKVQPQIKVGSKINIPNIDWVKNQKTLVIYVKEGCRFCTESMAFYKTLAEMKSDIKTKIIVASPDSETISTNYLKENGVVIPDVRQASLGSLGVKGTPTLLLINDKGEVSKSWVGRLPKDKEQEVINQL